MINGGYPMVICTYTATGEISTYSGPKLIDAFKSTPKLHQLIWARGSTNIS
jgi:hypothetical protein